MFSQQSRDRMEAEYAERLKKERDELYPLLWKYLLRNRGSDHNDPIPRAKTLANKLLDKFDIRRK